MSKDQQRERTTLFEVANRAGVSPSTVSLVLAGKGKQRRIPQDTRDRVRRAAEDLNYAPNLLTRSLKRGRTYVLSFFSTFRNRRRGDLYMDRIASAIETAGGELGYDILVHCNFHRSPKETYQFLNGGLADGLLIFAPRVDDPLLALLRQSTLPVVIVNGHDPLGQYSSASDDVRQGITLVADCLRRLGHRRVGALGSSGENVRDSDTRITLIREMLAERGIILEEAPIVQMGHEPDEGIEYLMSLPEPPTAVFCWHDMLAYRTIEYCESRRILVPSQLSVIGYDGVHWPSTSRHVCASVEVDLSSIALASVRLLDEAITQPDIVVRHENVPVRLNTGTTLCRAPFLQRSNL